MELQRNEESFDFYSSLDDSSSRGINVNNNDHPPLHSSELVRGLYTIPAYTSWFSWDDVHETERTHMKEFFDGGSISRTPKIYKEYRDFLINKYREDVSRRMTFTEVRKMMIGDVGSLQQVYNFLDKWGLINYQCSESEKSEIEQEVDSVTIEEGIPLGVKVIIPSLNGGRNGANSFAADRANRISNLPPLVSFSDVFCDLKQKEANEGLKDEVQGNLACSSCSGHCASTYYACDEGRVLICEDCFRTEKYGEGRTASDFILQGGSIDKFGPAASWSDAELSLLLEAMNTYADSWNDVAGHVKTKNRRDCVLKFMVLPSDARLGWTNAKHNSMRSVDEQTESNSLESIKKEDKHDEQRVVANEGALESLQERPLKRRLMSPVDAGNSLIAQVASLATVISPHVAAAAAYAAVTALADESPSVRAMLDGLGRYKAEEQLESGERPMTSDAMEINVDDKVGARMLQIRAAIATSFGAAAANARLLAHQEERELEHLMFSILETQFRKVKYKMKQFEESELIMEKEYAYLQDEKESILSVHFDSLQKSLNARVTPSL